MLEVLLLTDEERKEYKREWARANKDKRNEKRRIEWADPNAGEERRAKARAYYQKNAERIKVNMRIANKLFADKNRAKLLNIMGSKCVRCGFDDFRALQIDHVFGGGRKDKLISRVLSDFVLSTRAQQFKEGKLQLLCANCNWIKRHENNENRKAVA